MPTTHANARNKGSGPSPAKPPPKLGSWNRKRATSVLEKDDSKKAKRDEEKEEEEQSGKGEGSKR